MSISITRRVKIKHNKGGVLMGNLSQAILSLEAETPGAGHWVLDQVPKGATLAEFLKTMMVDAYFDEQDTARDARI